MANSRIEKIYRTSGLNRRVGGHKYTDGETEPILRTENFIVPGGMDRAVRSATPAIEPRISSPVVFPPPSIPQNLSSSIQQCVQVTLNWDASTGLVDSYTVQRSLTPSGYTTLASGIVPNTYVDTSVSNGITYYYVVFAVGTNGSSATSSVISATPQVAPITAPSGLGASQLSFSSSTVSWTDNSNNELGFRLDRSNNTGSTWAEVADVGVGVTTTVDTGLTTSSYWYRVYAYNACTTSLYSVTASVTITSGSEPPPTPPEAPIFLMVKSGSAILNWTSGSTDADFYSIHKSLTGEAGIYTEITTSPVLTTIDQNVLPGNTYWYKVAAVNTGGTSSFSNLAAIDIIPCSTASFEPIVHYGYIGPLSASVYRNTYGVLLPFTTSVSRSISVWARSPDIDTYLALVDDVGNILVEDDDSGWSPTGDYGYNSAFSYNLNSGSYTIELSALGPVDNFGRYYLYISPGPTLETEWSNSFQVSTVDYIPTSDNVVVGENGAIVIFYDKNTQVRTELTWSGGIVQGACYSPIQDKVYVWAYYLTDGEYTASIDEFDNTGSYLTSSYFFRAPVNTFPNVDFTGYLSYDSFNDRILFTKYFFQTTQSIVVWDCATRTILAYLNAAPYRTFGFWGSCYSEINNAYYVAQSYNSGVVPGFPMVKVDASTFAMSNTSVSASIVVNYISASNLMIIRRPGGKVDFYDPVTDTVVHNQTDLPSNGLYEGGGAGDICSNVYVAGIDPGGTPNIPGMALLDRNTYLPQNYLALSLDSASSANGWYQYDIAFSPNDSKLWSAQTSNDFNIGRLYSIRLSRATPPNLPPLV